MGKEATQFKPGHKLAPGGARDGAGRKPDWFKEKMAEIAGRQQSIEFIEKCIDGGDVDRVVIDGRVTEVPAPAGVRLAAWSEARDTGYGKPSQAIKMTGVIFNLSDLLELAELSMQERGILDA